MTNYQMFIDGEWVDSVSGETFSDINPANDEVYATVPKGDARDADRAIAAAYAARRDWAKTSPGERAKLLYKASSTLESRLEEFAEVLISEGGSMFGKAMFETTYTVDLLRTAGEDCRRILGETIPSDHDKLSMTIYQPRGVVVAISPWNFPLLLSINKVAYALAAGNTVALKPSSETPVTFTGETVTGRRIAELAGTKLKKYTLEMGGKDPLIILADADIDYAVDAAAFGAFMHQGQICMSVERIIVEEPIAEEFAQKLAAKAETLTVADPHQPTTVIGPLINDQQVQTVHDQVQDAVAKGARLLTGGSFEGRFYKPTVLADVTTDMKIFREETFGPTAPILKVKDEKEALEVANDSAYGLSSGIITNDLQKALFLAENLESGMVHINDSSVHDEPYCPFGGCKESGLGREGGRHSLEEMSELKWVTIQRGKRHYPF